jgi:membrane-associated phospholipid phosphatase
MAKKPLWMFHVVYDSGDVLGYFLSYFSQVPPLLIFFELFLLILLGVTYFNTGRAREERHKSYPSSVVWIWPGESLKSLSRLLGWLLAGQCIAEFIVRTLKKILKQERPNIGINHTTSVGSSSDHGMPSSHSQFIVFTCYFLIYYFKTKRMAQAQKPSLLSMIFVALALIGAVSFSRWYLEYHYPEQILVGWIIGIVFGHVWTKVVVRLIGL